MNVNAIYDFIKLGYLECKKQEVKRTARAVKMIPKASVGKFKSRYLLYNQLSLPKANDARLAAPNVDGCCVSLFSKTQFNVLR
ncbi:MAG: hypothetical protein JKY81_08045 [Colwellia sp.]|nr:hypothetical protein [Colwellia sp.]